MVLSSAVFADTYPPTHTVTYGGYVSIAEYCAAVRPSTTAVATGCMASDGFIYTVPASDQLSCPYGGNLSSSICVDAPPCVAPLVRSATTGMCETPPVVCSATEYDNGGTCTPIPNCNSGVPNGGNFFDVTTKACASGTPPYTACISDVNNTYCPPIDDCKPAAYICENDPVTVSDAAATRASEIAAIKADADAKKALSDHLVSAAADAAASKLSAVDTAKAVRDAAIAALAVAKASGDQAAISQAIKDFAKANDGVADALARASNSAAAKQKSQDIGVEIGWEVDAIPSSNPGNADGHDRNIDGKLPGLGTALDDAESGNGTGRGSGIGTSTSSPSIDTSGLGKDSSLKEISGKLNGGTAGVFGFGPDSFYDSAYPGGISQVWDEHKSALLQTSFASAISGLTPSIGGSGVCPSWSMPTLSGGTMELQPPCMIWPMLRVIFIITALFTARSLIFGG